MRKKKAKRKPIHILGYGDPGAGKTTFMSTLPKPLLVAQFDPLDKAGPFLKLGKSTIHQGEYGSYHDVTDDTGTLLVRVEYFHDSRLLGKSKKPSAYMSFLKRMDALYDELDQWASFGLDSVTYAILAARKMEQYVVNPSSRDPRQWYAGATESLEEVVMCGLANLPINVMISAHVDTQKDEVHGFMIFNPSAPGRLRRDMPAGYGELYHFHVQEDDGKFKRVVQTEPSDLYNAASQIGAPNPCAPRYSALWRT